MKTVISEAENLTRQIAGKIQALLAEKPEAALALTAGRSTQGLYALLGRMCAGKELSFAKARVFAVTEYVGAEPGCSCREILERELIGKTDLNPANFFVPAAEAPEQYEAAIRSAGGLDLCLLGIGINGHIGYNEPATPFDSLTHVQKLTDATRRQYEGTGRQLTERAVTMGIKTIVSSRETLLLATGPEKADAVFKMIYGRTDSTVPAAFLQIPLEVTAYLDSAAAEKL
ncbi:MAG: glucosamine-6-phosphate deaminase [Candidatus Limivicinus sp.]